MLARRLGPWSCHCEPIHCLGGHSERKDNHQVIPDKDPDAGEGRRRKSSSAGQARQGPQLSFWATCGGGGHREQAGARGAEEHFVCEGSSPAFLTLPGLCTATASVSACPARPACPEYSRGVFEGSTRGKAFPGHASIQESPKLESDAALCTDEVFTEWQQRMTTAASTDRAG